VPQQMQSPWYEFIGYGLELLGATSTPNSFNWPRFEGVLDKDEVATFEEIPKCNGPWYPRIYGQTDERVNGVRPTIILQGYDQNNNRVTSSDGAGGFIDGVAVAINGDTAPFWVDCPQAFSYITAIIKPVTKKNVLLYVTNGSDLVYIGQYAFGDTTPAYRQYSIPALNLNDGCNDVCVLARCRRRYVPITTDNDFLLISNLPALLSMVQATYYREAGDADSFAKYKLVAIDALRKEAKAYIGIQQQKPIMTISEGAGMRADGIYIL